MAIFKVTLRSSEIKTVAKSPATVAQKNFWSDNFLVESPDHVVFCNQVFKTNVEPFDPTIVHITDKNDENFISIAKADDSKTFFGANSRSVNMTVEDADGNVISNNFAAFDFNINDNVDEVSSGSEVTLHCESIETGVMGEYIIETEFFDFIDLNFIGFQMGDQTFVSHVMWQGTEIKPVEGTRVTEGAGLWAEFK